MMATETKNIADLVKSCFTAFNSLSKSLAIRATRSVAVGTWEDEAGRLRVWSGNLAAHQTGSASLSYRLRHAPSIRDEVIETLDVLLEALKEVIGILDDEDDEIDEEYVEELYEDVADSIEGLFRLTAIIRNPSRRDQLLERSNLDKTMEPFDKDYVRNKLVAASDTLIDRLGRANTQRRANFRYLLRRHEKFSQGLNDTDENQGDTKSKMSSAIATEFIAPNDILSASSGIDNEDTLSIGVSETSYASSFFTETSRRFPSKPQPTTNDGRFECPLCFYLIKANNIAAWRKHILVDLQPYVCLFPDCSYGSKLFWSRREWFSHQLRQHIRPTGDSAECPLCKESVSSSGAEKHLGRHLEDIALFTLPSSLFDDGEDGDEVDTNNSDDGNFFELEGDTTTPVAKGDSVDEINSDAQNIVVERSEQVDQIPGLHGLTASEHTSNFSKDKAQQGNELVDWDSSEAEQELIGDTRDAASISQRREIPAKAQAISPDNIDDIITTLSQMNIEQPMPTSNANLISKFTRSRRPGSPSELASPINPVSEDTQSDDAGSASIATNSQVKPSILSSESYEVVPYNKEYLNAFLGDQLRRTTSKDSAVATRVSGVEGTNKSNTVMDDFARYGPLTEVRLEGDKVVSRKVTKPEWLSEWSQWRDSKGDDSE